MAKKVAILQSNYIPWKGYFDLIAAVDEFIIYDDMQFTKRDWRNRNKIKTPNGDQWITVPVEVKGKYFQSIRETKIVNDGWNLAHWKSLEFNYKKAPFFSEIAAIIEPIFTIANAETISELNLKFISVISDYLGIKTKISMSWDYDIVEGKTERLAALCKQVEASEYVSGLAAKNYLDEKVFADLDVGVTWFDYEGYPEYPQLWGEFTHRVTILDLLFNCGKESSKYMRYVA